ncbi:uncharacterized protein LOC143625373 [Bidens hawaiensis]|uniref:uncharacterized protein LOC143625373 n=1 Tax=Bidens hawaiensis TaxID=980011 RepID=UPI00404A4DF1
MANFGANTNGSQFFISFRRQRFLDGCHVVFGKVIKGLETVQNIEKMGTPSGKPKGLVEITDCGEISQDQKRNVMESDIPQSISVGKEESEANVQKDNNLKKYESATLKNNVLVTTSDDRELTFEKPHQHTDDPSKSSEDKKLNVTESHKGIAFLSLLN